VRSRPATSDGGCRLSTRARRSAHGERVASADKFDVRRSHLTVRYTTCRDVAPGPAGIRQSGALSRLLRTHGGAARSSQLLAYPRAVPLDVVPASANRFPAVADVLSPGGKGACWCMYHRMSASEYGRASADELAVQAPERERQMRARCGRTPAPGMLAYLDGVPVGWCGLGPHGEFTRLVRSRTIPAPFSPTAWAVVCSLVRPGYRRRGVASALLRGAVDYARTFAAPGIEGYPVGTVGQRIDTTFAYVGTVAMFEAAGFRRIAKTDAHSARLARWVMRKGL
jgi:GNAT superfamily N-acetyltransferase